MERTGSIEKGIVSPDLLEERQKCNFDTEELAVILNYGKDKLDQLRAWKKVADADPILRNTHKYYDMTREEQMVNGFQKVKRAYELDKKQYFHDIKPTDYNYFFAAAL